MLATSDIPRLLSQLSAAQSASWPPLQAVLLALSTDFSALCTRVDALSSRHEALDARFSSLVASQAPPAPDTPQPQPPTAPADANDTPKLSEIPDSLDDLTQPPPPFPHLPLAPRPAPRLSPTTPAAPAPPASRPASAKRDTRIIPQPGWPPCGLPPTTPRSSSAKKKGARSSPPAAVALPPPALRLSTEALQQAKNDARSSPTASTLPPTTPRQSSVAARATSRTPSNTSSRLKRPRRRSKRSALPLRTLYIDDEDASPEGKGKPAKKARSTPRREERRPLAELNNRQLRSGAAGGSPKLQGFRSPAAAVRAAAAMQKKAQEKDTPRCKEVVRGEGRVALQAAACPECETFLRKEAEGRDDPEKAYADMVKKACRHRERFLPPDTPEEYWKLTFDETQTQPPPPAKKR